jgi:hypothetical protein
LISLATHPSSSGYTGNHVLRDFAVAHLDHSKQIPLPQKQKNWLTRCRQLVERQSKDALRGKLGRLRRRLDGAGRPAAVSLEYALFNWYVDMMGATKARIWPRQLLCAALVLKRRIDRHCACQGKPPPCFPTIDSHWVWRFMDRNYIVWRKSNVRYKVSRAKMMRRSKRTWCQSFQVRYGLQLLHGEERLSKGLRSQIHSHIVDQKPMHLNEAESCGRGTLCWKGMPVVAVKTDVGASRTRLSFTTHACDDPGFASPVEVCVKLKTDRCIKGMKIPDHVAMSLRNSESGSYDEEAFLAYLDRWVPKWTDERRLNRDYRIMFLDDYAVHNMSSVRQLLWGRGFFRVRTTWG